MQSISLAVAFGLFFASFLLWSAAVRKWRNGQPLIPQQPFSAPWGILDLAIALGIWLVGTVIAAVAGQAVAGIVPGTPLESLDPSSEIALLWISGITTLAICLLIAVALFIRHRVTMADLGWDPRFFATDVVLGLKAFAMLAPLVYGIQLVLTQLVESKHPLIEMLKTNPNPGFFLVAGFAAVIVAPVAEEFLFRVLLQGWLERLFNGKESTDELVFGQRREIRQVAAVAAPTVISPASDHSTQPAGLNPYQSPAVAPEVSPFAAPTTSAPRKVTPIVLSSAFFALSHWSHGPDPIPLFVFALGLGYLYQRTHRIMPCIILHLLLNACSLAALWMMVMT